MEKVTLSSGTELRLYDTLINKKSKVWYRVVGLSELGAHVKCTEIGEGGFKKGKAAEFVPAEVLDREYTVADFPPVKCYVDESLVEKPSLEKAEKEKRGAKEAYAARKLGVERTRRKHRK